MQSGGRGARRFIIERDLLLLIAGTLSAVFCFVFVQPTVSGGGETIAVAESLARHGRFADPFAANGSTGPTAHLAPLFPVLLAVLYWLGKAAASALVICAALAQGLQAALLPRISEQVFARSAPGTVAAGCLVALPIFPMHPAWENVYSGAALLAFCLAFNRLPKIANAVKCGVSAGLLLLLSPSLMVVIVCWVAYVFWSAWPGFRNFSRLAAAACLACTLVLLPWEIRNFQQLGGFPFVRDNFGLELYAANNDCAQATLIENLKSGCYQLQHPMFSSEQLQDLKRLGELSYNHDRERRALHWISDHPARFGELTLNRFLFFWFPPGRIFTAMITLLSLAGLTLALHERQNIAWFALAAMTLYGVPYYLVQSSERFRYPIIWISLLFAGYLLEFACTRRWDNRAWLLIFPFAWPKQLNGNSRISARSPISKLRFPVHPANGPRKKNSDI